MVKTDNIEDCGDDLVAAAEEGDLRIVTPGGSVDNSAFSEYGIGLKRDTEEAPRHVKFVFEHRVEDETWLLDQFAPIGNSTVLYGADHVWEMREPYGELSVSCSPDELVALTVDVEWYECRWIAYRGTEL